MIAYIISVQHRRPHKAISDATEIRISTRMLSSELCCPICLDLLTTTMTTKECLHRFCSECITTALLRGNKECPTCRKKLVSKRSLRPDSNFDALINKIWPDRQIYEQMQQKAMDMFHQQSNVEALQKSIEAGMKAQAANRRQRVQGSYDYEKRKRRPRSDVHDRSYNNSPDSNSQEGSAEGDENDLHARCSHICYLLLDLDSLSSTTDTSDTSDTTDSSSNTSPVNHPSSIANSESHPVVPPLNACTLKDRMHKWLAENPSSPLIPDEGMNEQLERRLDEDIDFAVLRTDGEFIEIEAELLPAKSLFKRPNVAPPLLNRRYIRTREDTTMEHLGEFLYQICNAEHREGQQKNLSEGSKDFSIENSITSSPVQQYSACTMYRPEHFYVYSRVGGRSVNKIFGNETILSALHTQRRGDHLMIFFDIAPLDLHSKSVLEEIVYDDYLKNHFIVDYLMANFGFQIHQRSPHLINGQNVALSISQGDEFKSAVAAEIRVQMVPVVKEVVREVVNEVRNVMTEMITPLCNELRDLRNRACFSTVPQFPSVSSALYTNAPCTTSQEEITPKSGESSLSGNRSRAQNRNKYSTKIHREYISSQISEKFFFREPREPRGQASTSDCAAFSFIYYNTVCLIPISTLLEPENSAFVCQKVPKIFLGKEGGKISFLVDMKAVKLRDLTSDNLGYWTSRFAAHMKTRKYFVKDGKITGRIQQFGQICHLLQDYDYILHRQYYCHGNTIGPAAIRKNIWYLTGKLNGGQVVGCALISYEIDDNASVKIRVRYKSRGNGMNVKEEVSVEEMEMDSVLTPNAELQRFVSSIQPL
ncbi:unnamed protein product [Thelazia callipaeda]|uniref:RING-type E3 ubiquitin transferase n=1 Tax=Thelazia callipaeda TaxID=103827 RepID=A0A0N5D5T0_THECL|nr:unnamed protein product [Thelazia callipaeda]